MNERNHSRMNLSGKAKIAFAIKMLLLLAILPISTQLKAQSFFGTIVGTVTDASGAVVPGATVKATNVGTGTSETVQSDGSGKYTFVNLVPGTYNVEVSKSTYKRFVREAAVVEVGQTTRVDAALTVGAVSETVEVSTSAPLLQTDSSSLGQEIEGAQVQEEPLNGRNVMNLIALAPGVVPTGAAMGDTGLNQGTRTAGGAGWGDYQIGGAIQGQSGNYIDGVANNLLGGNNIALVPTQDAIQEFNVASSNAGADFGRYSGGVVNMTTKSGTNTFHGSVWEYNRNRDYNANDWFSNNSGSPRGVWNQNQFGASLAGPLIKDKAFFMFTWEAFHALTANLTPTNVPTLALQNGIFLGQTLPADPGVVNTSGPNAGKNTGPICDIEPIPAGGINVGGTNITGTGTYIKNLYVPGGGLNPFNGAPSTCGDPSTEIMKQFYPLPNSTLASSNWFLPTPLGNNQEQYNARVDYTLSQRQRLFARYSYWAPSDQPHTEFNDVGYKNGTNANGTTWPTNDGKASYFTTQAVIGDTVTLSPTTILDVRLNYVRQYAPNLAQSTTVNEAQFGTYYGDLASSMDVHLQPAFNTGGGVHNLYGMGNYPNDGINWYNTYGINGSLTKIVGPHTLKIGAEARLMDDSGVSFNGGGSGSLTFSNSAWLNDEWANFLAGYSTGGTFKSALTTAAYMYYQGYYVADTWQAGRNLTINAGLRYELPGAAAERNNRATVLLPYTVDPLTGIYGTDAMVASTLYGPRTTLIAPLHLFAPNLGFAYRATSTTVVRGGFGMSFLPNDISGGWNPGGNIDSATASWSHPTNTSTATFMQTDLANLVAAGGIPVSPGRYNKPGYNATNQPTAFLSGVESITANPNNLNYLGLPATVSTVNFLNKGISGPLANQAGYPFTLHWNAALSHEFAGNMLFEVSYSGLKGENMPEQGSRQLDAIPDAQMLGSYSAGTGGNAGTSTLPGAATTCAAAPGLALAQANNTNSNKFTVGQCMRPYPYYNGVSDSLGYIAIENYKAFMARFEKRMGSAGVISANYTWSKNMGNTDTQNSYLESKATAQGGSGNGSIMDWNNMGGEYSLISYDVTNRTIVSYVTTLPFGKGKKFLNDFGTGLNSVVSGWTLNGITTFQSGFPIFFTTGNNYQLGNYGAGTERPYVVPGCQKKIGGSGLARVQAGAWFNTSCFQNVGSATLANGAPAPFQKGTAYFDGYAYGNEPRVDPTLRADGIKNFDVAIGKATPVWERASLAFRVEMFNVMNRVQFAPPVSTVGGGNYGNVTYQVNRPRQLQMSMRVNF